MYRLGSRTRLKIGVSEVFRFMFAVWVLGLEVVGPIGSSVYG